MRLAIQLKSKIYILRTGRPSLIFIPEEILPARKRIEVYWQYGTNCGRLQIGKDYWTELPPENSEHSLVRILLPDFKPSSSRQYFRFWKQDPEVRIFTNRYLQNHFPEAFEQLSSGSVGTLTRDFISQFRNGKLR
jgi:hypothetical protein